ncbi:MAG: T9SS type A sorting domain-containing protein [Taibaiella sp.]|nr:T9SS type A sorting domain-containing protein [Taibaiella sp.]
MKKALLLMMATAVSYCSFGTIDTLRNFVTNCQLDSPQATVYHGGFVVGMNNLNFQGAAESYDGTKYSTPAVVTKLISTWTHKRPGSSSALTSLHVTFKLWNTVDSSSRSATGTGLDSVTFFPGAKAADSIDVTANLIAMNSYPPPIGTGVQNFNVTSLNGAIPVQNSHFFVGYTMSTYNIASSVDTIGLCAAQHNLTVTKGHEDYRTKRGTHYLDSTRNCFLDGSGNWQDYYFTIGGAANANFFLCIVPVLSVTPASVGGVTRNNLSMYACYPNPAVNNTNIKFGLKNSADVTITIMDVTGRVINTIQQSKLASGDHIVPVSTSSLTTGNYIYMIQTSEGDALAGNLSVTK